MCNKEIVQQLIIKYEENENLYDVRNPDYLNRVKRAKSLFSICEDLQAVNKGITVDAIKKKIHTLRAQYIKESRDIASSKRSGIGTDDVLLPKLWCFDQLQFLKPHCSVRKSESNISDTDEGDRSFEINTEPAAVYSQAEAQPPCYKRRKHTGLEDKMENLKKLVCRRTETSSYDWFGKEVVFEITALKNERLRKDTVWEIQQVLRNASIADFEAEPQPSCSYDTPPRESQFLSIPNAGQHCSSQSSTMSTPDILQQPLQGLLDDDDF